MKAIALLTVLAIHVSLSAAGLFIPARQVVLSPEMAPSATYVTLDVATTPDQLKWGLMGRTTLPTDGGMLFDFHASKPLTFWMFNCLVDMSVAFLDEEHVIREIHDMLAYPEEMDKTRPVKNVADLALYPSDDPAVVFFKDKAVTSFLPSRYAFEVAKGWFAKHHVEPGDVLLPVHATSGLIIHTFDVSAYDPEGAGPTLLKFPDEEPRACSLLSVDDTIDIAFLDSTMKMVHQQTLKGNTSLPPAYRDVAIAERPVTFCLVAKKGWLQNHLLQKDLVVETNDR